ncbi:MAG: MBL fold metallo-hydrolase [Acidobacteria bacterium]|nr:MBL fold metallo-hydrolase [Acidobacteriota bacterium]
MAPAENAATLGFWGVRGSTPTVDRANWRYGGNTACLELVAPDGTHFILDCGTGFRMLGNRRTRTHRHKGIDAHIFVTHYHWDHIQGIPFFAPLYAPQHRFQFYSSPSKHLNGDSLKQVLESTMAKPYFPVDLAKMPAAREFSEVVGGDKFEINGTKITARWLNHPQGCLGFRFETTAGTIVYATDNEPGVPELDRSLLELADGADIFINDSQYTPEELATTRKGWGHSSWLEGVKVCERAKAKNLVLFHHDPDSSDRIVDDLLRDSRERFQNVWGAAEGLVMTLQDGKVNMDIRHARHIRRRDARFQATVSGHTEEGAPFDERTLIRDITLQGAYLYLKHCPQLQSEMKVTMDAPAESGRTGGQIYLRGFVVRREPGPEKDLFGVGLVFTEELDPEPLTE